MWSIMDAIFKVVHLYVFFPSIHRRVEWFSYPITSLKRQKCYLWQAFPGLVAGIRRYSEGTYQKCTQGFIQDFLLGGKKYRAPIVLVCHDQF